MATEAQPATQAMRILVVEDEVMIRMLLEDMLGELGYTVAAEAARMCRAPSRCHYPWTTPCAHPFISQPSPP